IKLLSRFMRSLSDSLTSLINRHPFDNAWRYAAHLNILRPALGSYYRARQSAQLRFDVRLSPFGWHHHTHRYERHARAKQTPRHLAHATYAAHRLFLADRD